MLNELYPLSCSKWSQFQNVWFLKEWNLILVLHFIASTKLNLTRKCTGILTVSSTWSLNILITSRKFITVHLFFPDLLSWWYLCLHNVCALSSLFLPKGDYSSHCCNQPLYCVTGMTQKYLQESISWNTVVKRNCQGHTSHFTSYRTQFGIVLISLSFMSYFQFWLHPQKARLIYSNVVVFLYREYLEGISNSAWLKQNSWIFSLDLFLSSAFSVSGSSAIVHSTTPVKNLSHSWLFSFLHSHI